MQERAIEAQEIKIKDLYSHNFIFNIPIYQRPLSWTRSQYYQLVWDIFEASRSKNEQYFLGSTILQVTGENQYDVIDGQQRLTALAILMAVIRDTTNTEQLKQTLASCLFQQADPYTKTPETIRIIPWHELREIFSKYIYAMGGTESYLNDFKNKSISYADSNDPRFHLYEAIIIFRDLVSQIGAEIDHFVTYLLTSVYMVYIKASSLTSAFRLFTVLNTRGLPLSLSDILKSEHLGKIPDAKQEYYTRLWRDIEEDLGRDSLEAILGFIRDIKLHSKQRYSQYSEMNQIFKLKLIESGAPFFDYVKEISQIYRVKILETELQSLSDEQNNRYRIILDLMERYVPFKDWISPILAFHHKFKSEELLLQFLLKLEKKVVLEWSDMSDVFRDHTTSFLNINGDIAKSDKPETIYDEMLTYYYKNDNKKLDLSTKDDVASFLEEAIDGSDFYTIHNGRLAKYLLLRLDMEMWDLNSFPGYPSEVSLEHVLPRNPSLDSQWMVDFRPYEASEWVNRLGNLVLLSGPKNSDAKNYDFARKKKVYFRRKATPFRITAELESIDTWDPTQIKQRHERLKEKIYSIYTRT